MHRKYMAHPAALISQKSQETDNTMQIAQGKFRKREETLPLIGKGFGETQKPVLKLVGNDIKGFVDRDPCSFWFAENHDLFNPTGCANGNSPNGKCCAILYHDGCVPKARKYAAIFWIRESVATAIGVTETITFIYATPFLLAHGSVKPREPAELETPSCRAGRGRRPRKAALTQANQLTSAYTPTPANVFSISSYLRFVLRPQGCFHHLLHKTCIVIFPRCHYIPIGIVHHLSRKLSSLICAKTSSRLLKSRFNSM